MIEHLALNAVSALVIAELAEREKSRGREEDGARALDSHKEKESQKVLDSPSELAAYDREPDQSPLNGFSQKRPGNRAKQSSQSDLMTQVDLRG